MANQINWFSRKQVAKILDYIERNGFNDDIVTFDGEIDFLTSVIPLRDELIDIKEELTDIKDKL